MIVGRFSCASFCLPIEMYTGFCTTLLRRQRTWTGRFWPRISVRALCATRGTMLDVTTSRVRPMIHCYWRQFGNNKFTHYRCFVIVEPISSAGIDLYGFSLSVSYGIYVYNMIAKLKKFIFQSKWWSYEGQIFCKKYWNKNFSKSTTLHSLYFFPAKSCIFHDYAVYEEAQSIRWISEKVNELYPMFLIPNSGHPFSRKFNDN